MWIVFCHISFHQLKNMPYRTRRYFQLEWWGGSGLTGTFIPTYKSPMEKFLAVAVKSVGRQWWNKTIFPTTQPQLPPYKTSLPNIRSDYPAQISALQWNKTRILTLSKVSQKPQNPLVSVTEEWKEPRFLFSSTSIFWCFLSLAGIFHTLRGFRGGFEHNPQGPILGHIS